MEHSSLRHFLLALALTPALAAAQHGDPEGMRAYIRSEFPNLAKLQAQDFIRIAQGDGMIEDLADLILAKRVFFELRRDKASGLGAIRFDMDRMTGGLSAAPANDLDATAREASLTEEIEYNDSLPYADALGASSFIEGSADDPGDLDYYGVDVSETSVVTVSVLPRGGAAIEDARLLIQNELGAFVAFNDDANGSLFPTITAILPAGSYRCAVDVFPGTSLGDYTLNLSQLPKPASRVILGQVTAGNITDVFGELYELSLSEASRLQVQFTAGQLDLRLSILRQDNGIYYFVDDSSSGLDPNFEGELPAGEYYLLVDEFSGAAGAYAFQVDAVAAAPTMVCDAAGVSGEIAGAESYRLYSLTLSAASELDLNVAAGLVDPIDDTVLDLLDADLRLIASNDDSGTNLLSSLQTFLPAGEYFVALRGFGAAAGSFTLSASCSALPAAQRGLFTANLGSTAAGDEALIDMTIKTPNQVELIMLAEGSHPDPRLTCVDAAGRRVLLNERGPLGNEGLQAGFLAPGDYMITVRSENNSGAGDYGVEIRPPLWIDETVPGICKAAGHHKADELVALFVGPGEAAPMSLFPMSLDGFLLLSSINPGVRFMFAPANGEYDFGEVPVVTCTIQGINFDAFEMSFFAGRWTDVINIVNGVIAW
ncbi:MAG: hypothetical protein ACYTG5_01645 [Planctomycetota bacterium]|jgi:hypothetical protein